MKLNIVITLALLTLFKNVARVLVIAKSLTNEAIESEVESLTDCSHLHSSEECLVEEGEKNS